jgi:hypothetical protein
VKILVAVVHRLELAAVNRNDSLREQIEPTAQHHELSADRADCNPVVLTEIGNRLEIRRQAAGQPHQLNVGWVSRSRRRQSDGRFPGLNIRFGQEVELQLLMCCERIQSA